MTPEKKRKKHGMIALHECRHRLLIIHGLSRRYVILKISTASSVPKGATDEGKEKEQNKQNSYWSAFFFFFFFPPFELLTLKNLSE